MSGRETRANPVTMPVSGHKLAASQGMPLVPAQSVEVWNLPLPPQDGGTGVRRHVKLPGRERNRDLQLTGHTAARCCTAEPSRPRAAIAPPPSPAATSSCCRCRSTASSAGPTRGCLPAPRAPASSAAPTAAPSVVLKSLDVHGQQRRQAANGQLLGSLPQPRAPEQRRQNGMILGCCRGMYAGL